jgi:hypothetical protein
VHARDKQESGLYWSEPNGHSLEVLTVPYGGWAPATGEA